MRTIPLRSTRSRATAALLAGLVLATIAGCESQAGQVARRRTAVAGPEESFQRILERLKRRLEQGPQQAYTTGGLDPSSDEVSHFSYEEEVTGNVIKPENEGEPYKARVVIKTQSVYIHSKPAAAPPAEQKPAAEGDSLLPSVDVGLGEGVEALLPDTPAVGPESGDASAQSTGGRTRQQQLSDTTETTKYYDLAYEDGKWVLKTEVDEESTKLIFEYALADQ